MPSAHLYHTNTRVNFPSEEIALALNLALVEYNEPCPLGFRTAFLAKKKYYIWGDEVNFTSRKICVY